MEKHVSLAPPKMCRGSIPITKRLEELWPDGTLARVKTRDFLVLSGISLAVS
jgi:hypothetical protein